MLYLYNTSTSFRTCLTTSISFSTRGKLVAWDFLLVSREQIQSHKREPEWTYTIHYNENTPKQVDNVEKQTKLKLEEHDFSSLFVWHQGHDILT